VWCAEVIPIALFTGTHQLAIAATLSPVVYVLIFLFCPLAWPISKLMDCVLGHGEEGAKFRRSELVEFVRMHEAEGGSPAAGARGPRREDSSMAMELNTVSSAAGAGAETGAAGKGDKGGDKGADGVKAQLSTLVEKQGGSGAGGGGAGGGGVAEEGATLTPAEVKILTGVLGMVKKVASSRMTPLRRVVMLPSTAVLDHDTMRTVSQSGYSRIPIFDADAGRQSIVGVFIPKLLLRVDPDARVPVDVLTLLQPPFVYESTHLLDVLDILRIAKTHLAIVVKDPSNPHVRPDDDVAAHEAVGILTLEDVLEELIMEKIGDESQILVGEDTMTRFRRVAGRKPSSSTPKKSSSSSSASASAPKAAARAAPAPPRTEGAAVLSTAPLARDEDEAHV
jgi:metal transporter CNNM